MEVWAAGGDDGDVGDTRCFGDEDEGRRRSVGVCGDVRPVAGKGVVVTMVVLVRPGSEYGE